MFLSQEIQEPLREGVIGSNFVNTHFAIYIIVFDRYDLYCEYIKQHTFMKSTILNVWFEKLKLQI